MYKDSFRYSPKKVTHSLALHHTHQMTQVTLACRNLLVARCARYLKRIAAHSRNIITSVVNPFDHIGYPYDEARR